LLNFAKISKIIKEIKFKFKLLLRTALFVALILAVKFLFVQYSILEFIQVSSMWSSLISATFFIYGFILSGILSDYKEAEKMPVEMVSNLETLNDECNAVYLDKKLKIGLICKEHLIKVVDSLIGWLLHDKTGSRSHLVNVQISRMSRYIDELGMHLKDPVVNRLKQEKDNLRKNMLRTKVIRGTDFAISLYTTLELLIVFIIALLLFTKFVSPYEAYFYTGVFSFIQIFLLLYIRNMDNPFDYYDQNQTADEISLTPLNFFHEKITNEYKIFTQIEHSGSQIVEPDTTPHDDLSKPNKPRKLLAKVEKN